MNKFNIFILVFFINNAIAQQEILETSLSNIIQFETDRAFEMEAFSSTSTENQFSNIYVPGVSSGVNLSRGELNASVTNINDIGYSSSSAIYETLNLDNLNSATVISYQIDVDFELSQPIITNSPASGVNPEINFAISIYDISGLDTWLEPLSRIIGPSFEPIDTINISQGVRQINQSVGSIRWDRILNSGFSGISNESSDFQLPPSRIGFPFGSMPESNISGQFTFTDSLVLTQNITTLGIIFGVTTFSYDGNASADLAFQFTELNNITFESGSGAFLSGAGVNPVPLPPAIWLFLSGVLGLLGIFQRYQIKT